MARFNKAEFEFDGMYLTYNGEFVARFKYVRGNAGPFRTFLIKHFTQEEYFARHRAGESPLEILQSKGYISAHIRQWLRDAGLPQTEEGYKEFLRRSEVRRMQREHAQPIAAGDPQSI